MQYFNYDLTNFNGINTSNGSVLNNPLQVVNWDYGTSKDSTTMFFGFLHKYPKGEALGDAFATDNTRGIHLFLPSVAGVSSAYRYIQSFASGDTKYHDITTDTWIDINTGFADLPYTYADFNYLDRVFYSNGRDAVKKWGRDWTTSATLGDKSNTPVAITGLLSATFGSDIIYGISCAFTTELYPGAYVRKTPTDDWYEVLSITDDDQLQINMTYFGSDNDWGTGTSEKAAISVIRARYLCYFNDRLFLASGDTSSLPIVGFDATPGLGYAIVGSTTTRLP